jgi:hypothetical protein
VKTAYIETSAINQVADLDCQAEKILDLVSCQGFRLATGPHTIFELARNFRGGGGKTRGQKLFSILRDLAPIYQPDPGTILQSEIEMLRYGTPVVPFLDFLETAATQALVIRLANGMFSDEDDWHMSGVEAAKKHELRAQQACLIPINRLREVDRTVRRLRTFDDVWTYSERGGLLEPLFEETLGGVVSMAEAKELASSPSSFPAITAAVRANVYLNFIMISGGVTPGKDKLDDYKHCFEASYCDAFLTADRQQETAMKLICPWVSILNWNRIVRER